MKYSTNKVVQLLGSIVAIASLVGGSTDAVGPTVAIIAGSAAVILKAIAGLVAHFSNTDGTPQTVAFIPKEKQ